MFGFLKRWFKKRVRQDWPMEAYDRLNLLVSMEVMRTGKYLYGRIEDDGTVMLSEDGGPYYPACHMRDVMGLAALPERPRLNVC